MLIQPNKDALSTHKILSPQENVAKLKEAITKQRQVHHPYKDQQKQRILNDTEMAVGAAMMPDEFIRRLRKLSPKIIVEKGGISNAVAVRVLVTDTDPQSDTYRQQIKKYISGFYTDRVLPEWSSFVNDKWGIPVREVRGWRSVLLALKDQGVVSYNKIVAEFGEPSGQRNILWREQTQKERG